MNAVEEYMEACGLLLPRCLSQQPGIQEYCYMIWCALKQVSVQEQGIQTINAQGHQVHAQHYLVSQQIVSVKGINSAIRN